AFSAGNDISDFEGSIGDGSAEKLIQAIVNSKKPVISAVNGLAFGGGFELVLACDISIASESSSFSFPEPKLGIFPPFGIWLLPQITGSKKAKYLMLTCDVIDAKEAEREGLISKVVPDDQLEGSVEETVEKIKKIAPLAIKEIKSGIDRYLESEELSNAMSSMDRLLASRDFKEGSEAFFEKRSPKFEGR
ncbi:MAG: enoyl-CoA hydratase-related protein, partial [Halobacteriota archaeon]|nr:enoyl-CoA hydratase-related protein [Halobacteriota archaeon]